MKMDEDSNFLFPAQSLSLNAPFLPSRFRSPPEWMSG